jgi:hypothetical protein
MGLNFSRLFEKITGLKPKIIWACPSVKTAGQAVRSRFYCFALRDKTIKSSTAILHAARGIQQ